MDEGDDSQCGQAMSPHKKPDCENTETISNAAAEEPNLKPLKKAHYVWQIKGNYHLKNSSHGLDARESSLSGAGSSAMHETMNCNSEPSTSEPVSEAEGAPPSCERHYAPSQPGTDTPLTNSSEPEYPPPPPLRIGDSTVRCAVCDTINDNIRRASLNTGGERSITPPLPMSHPDWTVRKWQTRQIAKAFMDNTINCVLEEMGFTPVPESAPDSDPDDVLGSINFPRVDDDSAEEEEEDETVENEGILSAIQSHGLQRYTLQSLPEAGNRFSQIRLSTSPPKRWGPNQRLIYQGDKLLPSAELASVNSDGAVTADVHTMSPADKREDETESSNDSNSDEDADVAQYKYVPPSNCRCAYRSSKNGSSSADLLLVSSDSSDDEELRRPMRPLTAPRNVSSQPDSSLKLAEQEDDIPKKRQGKDVVSSSLLKRRCVESSDEDSKCSSASSSPSSHSSQVRTSPGLEGDVTTVASDPNGRSSPTFGHFEFMDAAVAAAIQKKGLSALACQDL